MNSERDPSKSRNSVAKAKRCLGWRKWENVMMISPKILLKYFVQNDIIFWSLNSWSIQTKDTFYKGFWWPLHSLMEITKELFAEGFDVRFKCDLLGW